MSIKVLNKKMLTDDNKYHFCPYCVRELEKEGQNYKEILKPLWKITTVEGIKREDGSFMDYIDTHYECTRCHNDRITVDSFRLAYTCRPDGTKWNEPPKDSPNEQRFNAV